MDHVRPVPDGAPEGVPSGGDAARLADLLRRSALGDEAAFAEFYDATSARAYGLALRVVRNPAHAEEVAQEAYLDAWRSSTRYDADRGSAVGWLLTIVHRKAVDRVRSVEAASSREETWNREAAPTDHDQTAESAHASLDAARIRGAVATLTDVQRRAVELTYFGGYTHTEVATLLDVPLGTAKTRIRDGLIRLRDLMGVAS
ncbi:ECF RNA polymerase sigma factor SigK [Nocardioides sp. zg-1228]|uniref:ECF RNA polymerase sigma factor SigK n=1 Tax=Nocardioides sp. zg-1228 TaxID=2763008 RepID=UPI001642BD03|nr:ECF RNA polymerase sigma factor SigK [Nocardioides sp. zg-1228]MBC2931905.1 ECF RNA polymerase sigma factor SigK [Nocardioides sp. zg-1228]QSF57469.1 ECF RNA polymerase sigma factor SigK [Nocardioides sp. zg-1228]